MIKSKYGAELHPARDSTCAVERMRELMDRAYRAHCGECTFGREGGYQLYAILDDLTRGRGAAGACPEDAVGVYGSKRPAFPARPVPVGSWRRK